MTKRYFFPTELVNIKEKCKRREEEILSLLLDGSLGDAGSARSSRGHEWYAFVCGYAIFISVEMLQTRVIKVPVRLYMYKANTILSMFGSFKV